MKILSSQLVEVSILLFNGCILFHSTDAPSGAWCSLFPVSLVVGIFYPQFFHYLQ